MKLLLLTTAVALLLAGCIAAPAVDLNPRWEWQAQPVQSFAVQPSSARIVTWTLQNRTKAKFAFKSSTPVDFEVTQFGDPICSAPQMLQATIECEMPSGESVVRFDDTRTPGTAAAETALGVYVRDRNALQNISAATVTLNTSFFVCTRNCPPKRPGN